MGVAGEGGWLQGGGDGGDDDGDDDGLADGVRGAQGSVALMVVLSREARPRYQLQ